MTPWRFVLAVTVLVTAFLITGEALRPGVNMADLLLWGSPFCFLWVVWPAIPRKEP